MEKKNRIDIEYISTVIIVIKTDAKTVTEQHFKQNNVHYININNIYFKKMLQ